MEPQTIVSIINTSIIVLVTTIVYCLVLIVVRIRGLLKRWNKAEQKFYEETMAKLKLKEWRDLSGRKNS